MKKIIFLFLSIFLILSSVLIIFKVSLKDKDKNVKAEKECAIWLSYYEADFNMESEKEFEKSVDALYNNLKENNITTLYLHTRANCDAIYKSSIFTYNPYYLKKDGTNPDFDPLKILSLKAKEYNISLHGWVNPYRVSNTESKIANLPKEHPARKLLNYDNDAVIEWEKGIYLNPANKNATKLILDGIKELLKYDIDGIQFDDYFYPTTSDNFDKSTYKKYCDGGGKLSLADFRRANVDLLISSVYRLVKNSGKTFGISPMADIDTNYNEKYADVEKWILEDSYIDYIAPQIYYGFNNPYKPFEATFNKWVTLARSGKKRLFIGLASYKQGKIDEYIPKSYKEERKEWINNKNLLFDEAEIVKNNKYADGIIIFSYSNYFEYKNSNNRKRISKMFSNIRE